MAVETSDPPLARPSPRGGWSGTTKSPLRQLNNWYSVRARRWIGCDDKNLAGVRPLVLPARSGWDGSEQPEDTGDESQVERDDRRGGAPSSHGRRAWTHIRPHHRPTRGQADQRDQDERQAE